MKKINVKLYDAFTHAPFGGNVAGVVLDAQELDDKDMQYVGAELAAPTTGFVVRYGNDYELRFFTPTTEIDMCGHVVLGVAAAMLDVGLVAPGNDRPAVIFKTKAGSIPVDIEPIGPLQSRLMMTQNPPTFRDVSIEKGEMAEMLGIAPDDLHPELPIEVVSTALRHCIVPVRNLGVLGRLGPNNSKLARFSDSIGVETIPIVSLNPEPGVSARSRDLCPGIGNSEESASGTTNGALACWLHKHSFASCRSDGVITLKNQQGFEMGRPSEISVRLTVSNDRVTDVKVGGSAIRTLEGTMFLT